MLDLPVIRFSLRSPSCELALTLYTPIPFTPFLDRSALLLHYSAELISAHMIWAKAYVCRLQYISVCRYTPAAVKLGTIVISISDCG